MPELPEVETTRRLLEQHTLGSRIVSARVTHRRMVRYQPADDLPSRVRGRRISRFGRHGKYLLTGLDDGLTWVTHLGMSGRMQLASTDESLAPHTHLVVEIDSGRQIRMIDPRTFGFVAVLSDDELAESSVAKLGPDALEDLPRSSKLHQAMSNRRIPIKSLLLDQRFLAGLGNIYADEVLHRSKISPSRPANALSGSETTAMRAAIRPVLEHGLRWGGTSLEDRAYLLPDGRTGSFTSRLRAYGREGLPCLRCGTPIRRVVIGGRSSFFCPTCQP